MKKQVEINGLLWDTENLNIGGKRYFSWQEAVKCARNEGRRLPTKKEFESLIATGYEVDPENQGMWFAGRKIFFPFSGYFDISSEFLKSPSCGYYWSSSSRDTSRSWNLFFGGSSAIVNFYNSKNGFPIRCVQDKKKVLPTKSSNEESVEIDQIEFNNLKWDCVNFFHHNDERFYFDEAVSFAKKQNKRLPTMSEWTHLLDAGIEIDSEDRGIWVANRNLFLPFTEQDNIGIYWSSDYDTEKELDTVSCIFFRKKHDSVKWYTTFYALKDKEYNNLFHARFIQDIPKKTLNKIPSSLKEEGYMTQDIMYRPTLGNKNAVLGQLAIASCKKVTPLPEGYYAVSWVDSHVENNRWVKTEGYSPQEILAFSVGKVVQEDDNTISIASSYIPETNGIPEQCCGIMVIPKKSIVDIKRLYHEL